MQRASQEEVTQLLQAVATEQLKERLAATAGTNGRSTLHRHGQQTRTMSFSAWTEPSDSVHVCWDVANRPGFTLEAPLRCYCARALGERVADQASEVHGRRLFSVVLWELVEMVSEGLTITFAQLCYWFDPPEGISMRPGPNLVNICSIHARQPEVCFLESVVPCLAVASLHCSQAAPGQFLLVPRKFPCSLLFCRSRLSGCPLPAEKAARPRDLLTQTSERPAPTCQKLSMHLSG